MSNFFSKIYQAYSAIPCLAVQNYNFDSIHNYGLDYKIKTFLENYFHKELYTQEDCLHYLSLWRYEALVSICLYAKKNTLFYKDLEINEEDIFFLKQKSKNLNREEYECHAKKLIESLPFTQSADITEQNNSFLALSQDEVQGIVSVESSGTSSQCSNSKKKQISSSQKDFESTIQFFFFGMQYMLKEKEDKVALLISNERIGSIGHLFSLAMQRMHIDCKILGFSTNYTQLAHDIIDFKATCLVALSWHVHKLSSLIKEKGLKHSVKKVLLSGDTASKALKNELAHNLSCEVFDHYGTTEFGYAGAVECMEHMGMHERAIDLYYEIIDNNLKPVADNEFGEIVVTSLTREAMPLLRYRTGDRGRKLSQTCACGSFVPMLEVKGRISQGVQIESGKYLHLLDFQDFFFNYPHFICNDFNICLYEDAHTNTKTLIIGIESSQNPKQECLKKCQDNFNAHFNLNLLDYQQKRIKENKQSNSIEYIYLCSLAFYDQLIREKSTDECNKTESSSLKSLNAFINNERLNSVSAKKKIHSIKANLSEALNHIKD